MYEYIKNGAQLGWLIDPAEKRVWIYRPNSLIEEVSSWSEPLTGEEVLPGFILQLDDLWKV